MSDIFRWDSVPDADKSMILKFVAENNTLVREVMRREFPSLYIGRATEEVAQGWIMIAGLDRVMAFIRSKS